MTQYSGVDLIEMINELRLNFAQLTSTRRTIAEFIRYKPVVGLLHVS